MYYLKDLFAIVVVVVQPLSHIRLFATPRMAAHQASLSFDCPGACSNSCSVTWWCHPTISSSVSPFTSCPQSFPASGSFLVSHLFTSCGQNIGASALVQGWFPLGLTDLNSMQPKGLSRVFFNITVQKHQFLWSNSHIHTWLLKKKHSFDYMNLCWQSNVSAF